MTDPTWGQEITASENPAIEKLLELHSPEKIAAAYLRLYKSGQSAPEELSASGAGGEPRARSAFGPTVWFAMTGGREAGAEPRRLLPMLCKAGDITKDDIGAIRVQKNVSFIEIRQASAAKFVKAIGPNLKVEDNATLTQLEKPPAAANTPRPSFSDRQRDRKDKGPKRKSSKQQAIDHTNRDERDKNKKPNRKKSKGIPHSSENWEAELKRLEGAVTELKPKRKSEKPKPSDKMAKGKTGSTKAQVL